MRIIVHVKFLILVILFSSLSFLVKSQTPSHCSELYGCPPEQYDQEIEAEESQESNLEYRKRYDMAFCVELSNSNSNLEAHKKLNKKIVSKEINLWSKEFDNADQYDDIYYDYHKCKEINKYLTDTLRQSTSHCTELYGCQTEEFFSKDQTPAKKNIKQTKINTVAKKLDLNILKEACESIGFTPKTEPFGNCVLKLSERSDLMVTKLDKNVIESKNKGIQYVHKCSANTIESGQCYNYSCEHDTYMKDSYNSYRWNCLGLNPIFDQNYKKPVVSQSVRKKDSSSYNILEDLLSAGLIIGGAYLLGNALSSPSTAITPSPSIINKIQPSNGLIYGPYDTPFGY